ncbi:MAG: hypothetical protein LBH40_02565 [Alphaproteobacteria bacterium]|nr:hypothetical protein [Alphaproteobacteria bacterium]
MDSLENKHSLLKNRNKNKELNLHIVHNLEHHLGIKNLHEANISNLLNLKPKDIDELEQGDREFSLKDLNIICDKFNIDPDTLLEFDKFKTR